jgi:hypothetical protein
MLDDLKKERTHARPARETHHGAMRHHSKSRPMFFISPKPMGVNRLGQSHRVLVVSKQHNL